MKRIANRDAEELRLENLRRSIPAELPLTVSPKQFADLLSLSVKTIYEWLARGLLETVAIKQGKHVRILARAGLELFFTRKLGRQVNVRSKT